MRTKKEFINALDLRTNDTQQNDTVMLQKAINQGAKEHSPVFIPEGIYLVGTLFLKGKSHLIFEEGAVLERKIEIEAFPEIDIRVAGVEMKWSAATSNVLSAKDTLTEGKGIIDDRGERWWELYWREDQKSGTRTEYGRKGLRWITDYVIRRPRACLLYHAEHVVIRDLIFQKSGFWNLQVTYSNDVLVEKIIIRHNDGPSTDGIDIDSSTDVRIYEYDLACGDDCIAIKSGRDDSGARVNRKSSKIEVAGCNIRSDYGVTISSEVSAGVGDMYIHDIDFSQSDCSTRMRSSRERGGVIENIRVGNLNMMDVQFPFSWIVDWHNEYNRKNSNDLERMPESWQAVAEEIPESKQMTEVRNIHVKNIQASLSPGHPLPFRAFDSVAFPEKTIEDICFTHCTITAKELGRIEAVQNLCFESCILSVETGNTVANNTFDNR